MKQAVLLSLATLFAAVLLCRPAMAGHANGTIIQVPGNERLYYVINGYAAHIPSPAVMQCLQLGKAGKVMVTQEELNKMPKSSFLVEGGDGKIYRVDGDVKRHVPNMDVFKKLGFNSSMVLHLPAAMVDCIRTGTPLH